jgi:hypothetical protein
VARRVRRRKEKRSEEERDKQKVGVKLLLYANYTFTAAANTFTQDECPRFFPSVAFLPDFAPIEKITVME